MVVQVKRGFGLVGARKGAVFAWSATLLLAAGLVGCGEAKPASTPEAEPKPVAVSEAPKSGAPKFGMTSSEIAAAEEAKRIAGLGTYWVVTESATEHSAPGGAVVNKVYYGQKTTVYEKRGDWYRVVQDGFVPRWMKASSLSSKEPPEKPKYAPFADARVKDGAIPNPGESGLSKKDVDILWKGARQVLNTNPGCGSIVYADKSVSKKNTYFVRCDGSYENIFFTAQDVARLEG